MNKDLKMTEYELDCLMSCNENFEALFKYYSYRNEIDIMVLREMNLTIDSTFADYTLCEKERYDRLNTTKQEQFKEPDFFGKSNENTEHDFEIAKKLFLASKLTLEVTYGSDTNGP